MRKSTIPPLKYACGKFEEYPIKFWLLESALGYLTLESVFTNVPLTYVLYIPLGSIVHNRWLYSPELLFNVYPTL